jgi:hypothetical protein
MPEIYWFAFRYPKEKVATAILPHSEYRKVTPSEAVRLANERGAISEKVSTQLSDMLDIIADQGQLIVACLTL